MHLPLSTLRLWLVRLLAHDSHVDAIGGEVPEHFDQIVWEGVEVDVEFTVCIKSA